MRPLFFRVLSSWVLVCVVLSSGSSAATTFVLRRETPFKPKVPVIDAARGGVVEQMRSLLGGSTAVNRTDDPTGDFPHMTPLMVASEKGHTQIVRMLLKAKADLHLRVPRHRSVWPPQGWSARCFARSALKPGPEKLLVQAGASGDEACLVEADFLAAVRKKDAKRALLLGGRAKGQIQQEVLRAALDLAREQQSLAMVRAVDAAGFNPRQPVHVSLRVAPGMDVSMRPGSSIIITIPSLIERAMEDYDEKAVLALVKAGHPPPGLVPLMKTWMDSVVLHLVKTGAHPDSREEGGDTPLITALQRQNPVLVDALLTAGADVNLLGKEGMTPLMAALRDYDSVEVSLVERLLDAKADINKATGDRTPLMEAASRCLPKVVALLLRRGARWDVLPDGGAGLYEEAVVSQVSCPERVTVQVIQALREGGVPLQHPDETHLDWLRVRARKSQMLASQLYAAGLRPEKAPPKPPPGASR
ncbi:ankyrin repeat domain-containing protein [Myxococcus landrumensis]|uniref:Ankyrin repeat domain-containing protein n=1 Tax=Myxococcus landrumensis TaxID=2813577 RepID=A0ABX7N125_9BACT|nr:ankyrin repeat domain-containing protein [Myxococcus landrumus]QSQ12288.1 ankyrin repeat domain-containing protein [Myxococcus landrumus]